MNNKLRCEKCGKVGDDFGHRVMMIGEKVKYYHWECYDKKYNAKIDAILKDSHKDDKK